MEAYALPSSLPESDCCASPHWQLLVHDFLLGHTNLVKSQDLASLFHSPNSRRYATGLQGRVPSRVSCELLSYIFLTA